MSGSNKAACHPFFLEAAEHHLFSFACRPAGAAASHGVLVCPPFADEMNRSRRTTRLLCEELAVGGMLALSTDLSCTGDSSGEFSGARWDGWVTDLRAAAEWLAGQGCTRLSLVGIRAGALLAWELLRQPGMSVKDLVLWQPVLAGKSVITDMLRARVAAAAAQGGSDTVTRLRQKLNAGESVESAGYALAPELAAELESAAIGAGTVTDPPDIFWLEIGSDASAPVRPPAVQLADALRTRGVRVDLSRQEDPPFWSTTETTIGRKTVATTVQRLTKTP